MKKDNGLSNFKLCESIDITPADWHELTLSMDASYYLSTDYAEVLRRDGNLPVFFRLEHEGRTVGISLGAITNTWRRWPSRNLHRGFKWNTHPRVEDNSQRTLDVFVELILGHVNKRHRPVEIDLGSEDATVSPNIAAAHGLARNDRLEFRIDLSGGPEQVLGAIQRRKREKLKAQLKDSTVTVEELNTRDAILSLIEFQRSSRDRRRTRGEDYSIASESAAQAIYENYVSKGNARIFLASDEYGPVSGILLHTSSKAAYYTMSGCAPRGFEVNAQTINVWRAIETLHKDGFSVLNMGGVKAEAADPDNIGHGLYRFKKSFGGIETRCTSWHSTAHHIFERFGKAFFYR